MARTAIATLQPVWDCRWSRPGHRLTGVSDRVQPESTWVCIREGARRNLRDDDCTTCAHWELGEASTQAGAVALQVATPVTIAPQDLARVSLRAVLVLIAITFIATGVAVLTRPLAMPLTISLWLSAAAMLGLAVFWRMPES